MPQIETGITTLLRTPLEVFNCPTRRHGGPHPVLAKYSQCLTGVDATRQTVPLTNSELARADYAGNAGSQSVIQLFAGPPTLVKGSSVVRVAEYGIVQRNLFPT